LSNAVLNLGGDRVSDYNNAWSILNSVSGGDYIGDNLDGLTTDQKLKAAEVVALLAIAQELSALNPQNTMTRDDDGTVRNGWGLTVKE
jgi:hypothetical protein